MDAFFSVFRLAWERRRVPFRERKKEKKAIFALTIIKWNFRSLRTKVNDLSLLASSYVPNIIFKRSRERERERIGIEREREREYRY